MPEETLPKRTDSVDLEEMARFREGGIERQDPLAQLAKSGVGGELIARLAAKRATREEDTTDDEEYTEERQDCSRAAQFTGDAPIMEAAAGHGKRALTWTMLAG
jgi:hypothetical protein